MNDNSFTTGMDETGIEGSLTVGTTAIELKVGSSVKSNRISASILNNSSVNMYWGYTTSVTTSTGTPIKIGQFVVWDDLGATTKIYIIAATNGNDARITEVSG